MTKETPNRPSADNTRKVILNAARDLFVKKGFAGTSISEIAKQAKVNQSLIYHHYANKESLWTAVLQWRNFIRMLQAHLIILKAQNLQLLQKKYR